MSRVRFLRAGYAALALALFALAGSALSGALLLLALPCALAGGILLALSRDDLPRGAGITLLAYFLLTLVFFLLSSPITLRGNYFVNGAPPALAEAVYGYLVLALPVFIVAAGLVASWEREWPARTTFLVALIGFLLVGVLNYTLLPSAPSSETATSAEILAARAKAETYGHILQGLFAVFALAGAIGATWSAARPDEYA